MSLAIDIAVNDQATPILAELHRELSNRTSLHKYIGAAAESGTRLYIRKAAETRHTTAAKLKAVPTGYLTKRAELVEGSGNADNAQVTVIGAMFRRVFGPVTIRPREAKMLTIPIRAESYGKRAGEFKDLFVYRSKQGRAFLARQGAQKGRLEFLFLLKSVAVLPQDRGLIPSDEQFAQLAELGARGYLRKWQREHGL